MSYNYEQKAIEKMDQAEKASAVGASNLMHLRIAYAIVIALNNIADAIRSEDWRRS